MRWLEQIRRLCVLGASLALLCALVIRGRPEQLPLKLYTTADGLSRDGNNRIIRDSRGFLWFATHEGLSRFDGYQFTNFTAEQGLPQGAVNDILETRSGELWFATNDGVVHFNPRGSAQSHVTTADLADPSGRQQSDAMFVTYYPGTERRSRAVNALAEDHDGSIWCASLKGLYKLESDKERWTIRPIDVTKILKSGDDALIEAIAQDADGSLWIGTDFGLYRRFQDGTINEYKLSGRVPGTFVNALFIDRKKTVWVGTRFNGLYKLNSQLRATDASSVKPLTAKDGLGSDWIASIFECSGGTLWVGTNAGLSKAIQTQTSESTTFVSYTTAQGLSDAEVWAIGEDESGSLWLGTANGGAMKFVQDGFNTYDERDGLGESHIVSIFEDQTGHLCVVGALSRGKSINCFDGKRFTSAWPRAVRTGGWGWSQVSFQDREGDWWLDS